MNECLKIMLSLSLCGSVLILILMLLCPIFRSRLSKRWQYYIWLIVIARMLFPFSLKTELNLTSYFFQKFSIYMDTENFTHIKQVPNTNNTDSSFINTSEANNDVLDAVIQDNAPVYYQAENNLSSLILFF